MFKMATGTPFPTELQFPWLCSASLSFVSQSDWDTLRSPWAGGDMTNTKARPCLLLPTREERATHWYGRSLAVEDSSGLLEGLSSLPLKFYIFGHKRLHAYELKSILNICCLWSAVSVTLIILNTTSRNIWS